MAGVDPSTPATLLPEPRCCGAWGSTPPFLDELAHAPVLGYGQPVGSIQAVGI